MKFNIPIVTKRSQSYKQTFDTPQGKKVLADLRSFCKMNASSFAGSDTHTTSFNEGRREVFLRIMRFINLTQKELDDLRDEEY